MCFPLTVSGIIRICWDQRWLLGSPVHNSSELPPRSGWVWPGSPQGSPAFSTESVFSYHIPCTTGLRGKEGDLFAPRKHFQITVPSSSQRERQLFWNICLCVLSSYHQKLITSLLLLSALRNFGTRFLFVFLFSTTTLSVLGGFNKNGRFLHRLSP